MGRNLTIPYYRPTFVKGEVTTGTPADGFVACGPETANPMRVTVDQLAELYYRVRDATWTGGSMTMTNNYGNTASIYAGGASFRSALLIEDNKINASEYAQCQRGHSYRSIGFHGDWWVGQPYGNSVAAPPTGRYGDDYQSGAYDPAEVWRDILDDELGMWGYRDGVTGLTYRSSAVGLVVGGVSSIPPTYAFLSSNDVTTDSNTLNLCTLDFSGEVAWVDDDESGNPFSSGNRLFVGVRFAGEFWQEGSALAVRSYLSSVRQDLAFVTGGGIANYVQIELASGTVTFPIYAAVEGDFASWDLDTSYPFVLTADKWWPYAKPDPDNPGETLPVWDTTTGAKL